MKYTLLLLTVGIILLIIPINNSTPDQNGTNPGCEPCHSFDDGIVSASATDLQVQISVSGTSGDVAGELVDGNGTVVAVNNGTSSNPFTLTAPGPGNYTVNAGHKSPLLWDSAMVIVGSPPTTFALTVNVTAGWNMVSVPGTNPAGMGVTDWWSGKDPAAGVFKYAGGYVEVFTTAPAEGYWMKNSGAQVYSYPAINIVTHNSIAAAAGWNMIGGYELTVPTASLVTTPPNLINTPVFEYSGGYQNAVNIVPGYGYWVKMDAAGTIDSPPLAKGTQPVEYFPEDWGKILLTDATGINYTLYAVTGEVNLDKYELPPMPPAGMFDIRFSSGRIAEDINSSIQTIDMSGVTYPLTVRVEGMDIRLTDETGKTINVKLKSGEDVVISDATIQKLIVTEELLPTEYSLEQNYPNPFNPSTVIEFSLPEVVGNVKLSIYNALGEKVAELVNTSLTSGKYQYQWNAKNVATGMYIYELRTDKFISVKKMIFMK